MTEQRRLAAILVADVVGYSKLVGSDEVGTLAKLVSLKREVIEPAIGKHSGRLFKAMGDGFLVEFASAVQAVNCAVEIQKAQPALPLRIGIHLGDVVVQGDDLMGDGVNIAARIEGIAEAGGIAISRQIHDQVRDKLDLSFTDKGEVALKNIARPVQVFALAGTPTQSSPLGGGQGGGLAFPDKPSIAVLPFQNMSGDPEQEYFADGMVEDIITALSRFKSLFVIARNSSFTYKGKAVDIRQVGRELGVRYVLEGSVRKAGGRVRITGQLIEAESGVHLWADRFDGSLEDVFALQDQMTTSVVGAIAPRIDRTEIERARRKPPENLDAYDLYLRAMSRLYELTKDSWQDALRQFYSIIEIAPDFVLSHAMAARCYAFLYGQAWSGDTNHAKAEVRRLATYAAAAGQDDAVVLSAAGYALFRVCEDDETGAGLVDRALSLNQNLAVAWAFRGAISIFLGDYEIGLEQLSHGMRLNPLDPEIYWSETIMSNGLTALGRYDEAIRWATQARVHRPSYMPAIWGLAAANALAGNLDEARSFIPRIRAANPEMRQANLANYIPNRRLEVVQKFAEAMRLAGFSE